MSGAVTQGDPDRIRRLWMQSIALGLPFNERSYATYVLSLVSMRSKDANADIIQQVGPRVNRSGVRPEDFHWSISEANRIETVFAVQAKNAIREQDRPQLEATLDGITYLGLDFSDFNWGSLATDTGRHRAGELLRPLWQKGCRAVGCFNEWTWGSFAEASRKCGEQGIFRDIWEGCVQARASFSGKTWGVLASAAGRFRMSSLVEEVWLACESARDDFNDWTWGALLHAAGECDREDLLREMWVSRGRYLQAFLGSSV